MSGPQFWPVAHRPVKLCSCLLVVTLQKVGDEEMVPSWLCVTTVLEAVEQMAGPLVPPCGLRALLVHGLFD